jgi:hypothetical protein
MKDQIISAETDGKSYRGSYRHEKMPATASQQRGLCPTETCKRILGREGDGGRNGLQ